LCIRRYFSNCSRGDLDGSFVYVCHAPRAFETCTWFADSRKRVDESDECQAGELVDGSLYMTLRSRHNQKERGFAFSKDGGVSWSPVRHDPRLPEPSCQGSVVRFSTEKRNGDNRILLTSPAKKDVRTHLTVYLSTDQCQSWPVSRVVCADLSSYSDLAVTADRNVLLLYEADNCERLIFARFNLAWLMEKANRSSE
jgi:sialidase-1